MSTRLVKFHTLQDTLPRYGRIQPDGSLAEIPDFFRAQTMLTIGLDLEAIKLVAPIPHPISKIIAVGMNYREHIAEMQHQNVPDDPVLFLKAPSSIIGPNDTIQADPAWGRIDYEGELAVMIGRTCRHVPEAEALEYVLGYTLANDVTARDLQRKDPQWGRAKNFDTFCPLGPALLLNEGQNPADFRIRTEVDAQVVQDASVSDMRFSVPFLVAYISSIMTLEPGDLILTGTPKGVGPLQDGQRVRITIPEIGSLENTFNLLPAKNLTGASR